MSSVVGRARSFAFIFNQNKLSPEEAAEIISKAIVDDGVDLANRKSEMARQKVYQLELRVLFVDSWFPAHEKARTVVDFVEKAIPEELRLHTGYGVSTPDIDTFRVIENQLTTIDDGIVSVEEAFSLAMRCHSISPEKYHEVFRVKQDGRSWGVGQLKPGDKAVIGHE